MRYRYVIVFGLLAMLSGCMMCEVTRHPEPVSLGKAKQSIINGKPDLRHPASGALTFFNRFTCSGTLIASRVVLTAAHCVDTVKALTQVFPGLSWADFRFRIERPSSKNPQGFTTHFYSYLPEKAITHPKWDQRTRPYQYDIAIIVLAEPVPSSIAKPIPFNQRKLSYDEIVGKSALVQGYGYIKTVPLFVAASRKYGAEIPMVKLTPSFIEFGSQKSKSHICYGDSGGPALLKVEGELRVISVHSHAEEVKDLIPGSGLSSLCNAGVNGLRTDIHTSFLNTWLVRYGDGKVGCKQNSECGFCLECSEQKRCTPKEIPTIPDLCKPCSKDTDCVPGVCALLKNGYRCIQPCAFGECCPGKSVCTPLPPGSMRRYCMPADRACPDVSCRVGSDCGKSGECVEGICRRKQVKRQKRLCFPCQTTSDCGTLRSVCYGPSGTGRCLQACESGLCPSGFSCRVLYRGFPPQCVPLLSSNSACALKCSDSTECPKGWTCEKGNCRSNVAAKEGEVCSERTCEKPLRCVLTGLARRCLNPCSYPRGVAGSSCRDGNQCVDGATCSGSSEGASVCLHSCQTNQDCEKNGGLRCFYGYCMCDKKSDCKSGFVCNTTTGYLGACTPEKEYPKCPKGRVCVPKYRGAAYCQAKQPGTQALGEPCEAMNPCMKGLTCTPARGGGICLESCFPSGRCGLGGTCSTIRGRQVCVCRKDDCPSGSVCTMSISSENGVCRVLESSKCLAASDCPPGISCVNGICQVESLTEPTPKESFLESEQGESKAPRETARELAPNDAGSSPEPRGLDIPPPPSSCVCSSESSNVSLWLLLCLLFVIRLRRTLTLR